MNKAYIFFGSFAAPIEKLACEDLKVDLENTTNLEVEILEENQRYEREGIVFIVGSLESNAILLQNSARKIIPITKDKPGKRGGCIHIIERENKLPIIMLAGSDPQGCQYMVYDFSRYVLGVDPFNFWTGYKPKTMENIENLVIAINRFGSKIIEPPLVPIKRRPNGGYPCLKDLEKLNKKNL